MRLDGDTLEYDYLVLATGSTHHYFGNDSWASFAPGLKSIDDAWRSGDGFCSPSSRPIALPTRPKGRRLMTTVIVGGGATGL